MSFKIQNMKLALLALIFIAIFTSLGIWQLSRATEKKLLIKSYTQRTQLAPLTLGSILEPGDWRFYRIELTGEFDNAHTLLLDNKIVDGKVGYEVYTPFHIAGWNKSILVDRGFVRIGTSRRKLPAIAPITGKTTIDGMLNLPPTYVKLGQLTDTPTHFPMRIEYIRLPEIAEILQQDALFSYVLLLNPTDARAYPIKWEIVTMKPEKHMAYAVQWFAFALTLLILFVALNRPTTSPK